MRLISPPQYLSDADSADDLGLQAVREHLDGCGYSCSHCFNALTGAAVESDYAHAFPVRTLSANGRELTPQVCVYIGQSGDPVTATLLTPDAAIIVAAQLLRATARLDPKVRALVQAVVSDL